MKKTKLTQLLSSFSNTEIKRFINYLNSPYHNNKAQFLKTFEEMAKYHPNYENDKLKEEILFNMAYPEKRYSYVLFKNLISDLYELAKNFMAVEELGKNKLALKNLFLLNLFAKPNIKDLIEKDRGLKLDYSVQVFIKSIISERLKIKPVPERIKNKILRKINPSKKFLATFFSRLLF